MASISSLLVPGVNIPQPDHSWISGAFDSIGGAIQRGKQNQSFNKLADLIATQQGQAPAQQPTGGLLSRLSGQQPQQAGQPTGAAPVTPVRRGQAQGSTYRPFIETVRAGGVNNPNALAAIAAYGDAESGWNPKNAVSTWSDPSESGQPGTSGGILSWRGDRYARLAAGGDLSPEAQARYFLQEDPQLIAALNNAQSPEEASRLMANAWKFAGYDKPGGEGARRAALARNYYANEYANQPASNGAAAAIEAQAPGGMGSPLTEQAFDDRFGPAPLPAEQLVGQEALAGRLTETNAAGMPAQQPVMDTAQPMQQPAAYAPNQVADASGAFAGVPGVAPIPRGGVSPEIIQTMLRDPNLREMGLKLWAQNVQGPNNAEPWQFVQGADGTLLRANQVTGEVMPIGNFAKTDDEPKIVELFDQQTGQPYKAQYNPKTKEYDRVGGVKARSGMQLTTNPDGTVTLTEGAIGGLPKLTESEGKNSGFYGRGVESQKTLNELESQGTSIWNKVAGSVPVAGNFLRSEASQKYDQAKRNFINAVLRRESGAVISPEEFANAEIQYFPQPGDGPEVIEQKRRNRDTTIQGLKISAGQGAAFAVPSEQPTPRNGTTGKGNRTSSGVTWEIVE